MKTKPSKKKPHFGDGLPELDQPRTLRDVEEIKVDYIQNQFVIVYVYRSTALKMTPNVFNKPIRKHIREKYGIRHSTQ